MKRSLFILLCLLALLASACCKSKPVMEALAMQRLPASLEKAMLQDLSLPGGAEIISPETIYVCDSLCIIQFDAVAKDSLGQELRFPVRYALVRDGIMSAATGRPYYAESITGAPRMDSAENEEFKQYCRKEGTKMYEYYVSVGEYVDLEELR